MPYAKKTTGKRRRFSRKNKMPFSKRQVKAIQKISTHSGEVKQVFSTSTSSGVVAASPFEMAFPTIAKGVDDNDRVADQITIKDIHYKLMLKSGSAVGNMRCYIYQLYRRPETSSETSQLQAVLPNDWFPRSEDVDVNYKILYDKVFYLNSANLPQKCLNIYLPSSKLKMKKLEWDADTGLHTELLGGDIILKITTDNTTATQITVDGNIRVRYYDS